MFYLMIESNEPEQVAKMLQYIASDMSFIKTVGGGEPEFEYDFLDTSINDVMIVNK